jgi:hypothetical protein
MTNLLTFLSVFFYLSLTILFAVTIIEQRRAERRSYTDQAQEERSQKAA